MDSCRTLCLLSLLAVACGGDNSSDTGGREGFFVVSSTPEQGATDVAGSTAPEFLLSQPANPEACNDSQFELVATDEAGEVAFDVDFSISLSEDALTLSLTHSEPFLSGFWYVAMATTSESPCTDISGDELTPFGVEFYVP